MASIPVEYFLGGGLIDIVIIIIFFKIAFYPKFKKIPTYQVSPIIQMLLTGNADGCASFLLATFQAAAHNWRKALFTVFHIQKLTGQTACPILASWTPGHLQLFELF